MKILVAEDNPVSRALLVKQLETAGHEVTSVANGQEAWELYRQQPVPIVITDWEMPELDGLELTARIRKRQRSGRLYTYIILLTGHEGGENHLRAIEAGVDDFVRKEDPPYVLKARLIVGERHAIAASYVSALPICMDCKSVRDADDSWMQVEEFFGKASNIQFSHGLCPDCYYDNHLRPELDRWHQIDHPAPPVAGDLLDPAYLDALRAFESRESPDLLLELVESVLDTTNRARREVRKLKLVRPQRRSVATLTRFRDLCTDVGAASLAEGIEQLLDAPPETGEQTREALLTLVDDTEKALRALVDSV